MESRKRKVIASLLDDRHLQRLPKVRDKLSNLVRTKSQTASSLDCGNLYPGSDDTRHSRLDFTREDLGGSGLGIDLRSLEAFHNADQNWFGHDTAAPGGSSTPIADQYSNIKGAKGNATLPLVDQTLPPQPRQSLAVSPNGQGGRHPYVTHKSDEVASIESLPQSAGGRSVSVLERRRGVGPRLSKERLDPSVEPIRIKLATTSQPAELQRPPPLEPTWKAHVRRTSQQASTFSDNASATATTPRSPRLSGVNVKAHIRRCSQNENQIEDGPDSASKRQSMPASMPGFSAGRSGLGEIKNSLHSDSKTPAPPGDLLSSRSSSVGRSSENPPQAWFRAPPTNLSTPSPSPSSIAPAPGVRRNTSTRAPGGVKRLAWIKELEERKDSSPGLNRELPVLRKVQGSVADKLARFEHLGQQPDNVTALSQVSRTRSNSISSQRSFLTSTGSRPASWYQGGSTIATTTRTSTDSHRPPSVLLNYDETFREKMQVVAGKYDKQDLDQESEGIHALEGQAQSGEPDEGKSGQIVNQSHRADSAKTVETSDNVQEEGMSNRPDSGDQPKPAETPHSAQSDKTEPVETPELFERTESVEKVETVGKLESAGDPAAFEKSEPGDTSKSAKTAEFERAEAAEEEEAMEQACTTKKAESVKEASTVARDEADICEKRVPVEEAELVHNAEGDKGNMSVEEGKLFERHTTEISDPEKTAAVS